MLSYSLLSEALYLTMLGMGIVFTFLCLLVIATIFSSYLINLTVKNPVLPQEQQLDNKIIAAISMALHLHRGKN